MKDKKAFGKRVKKGLQLSEGLEPYDRLRFEAEFHKIFKEQKSAKKKPKVKAVSKYPRNLLNSEEAAEFLGITKSALYQYTCRKEIPFYKPGGKKLFFELKDLEEFMKAKRVSSRDELEAKALKNYLDKEEG